MSRFFDNGVDFSCPLCRFGRLFLAPVAVVFVGFGGSSVFRGAGKSHSQTENEKSGYQHSELTEKYCRRKRHERRLFLVNLVVRVEEIFVLIVKGRVAVTFGIFVFVIGLEILGVENAVDF